MKLFALTYFALSALTFAAPPRNVVAVWSGGAIEVSWDETTPPPSITYVQRISGGVKDRFDLIALDLAHAAARATFRDPSVAENAQYEYRVKFGRYGEWSPFIAVQNDLSLITPLAPSALPNPALYPPEIPTLLSATQRTNGVLLVWCIHGDGSPSQAFFSTRYDILQTWGFPLPGVENSVQQSLPWNLTNGFERVTYVASENLTTYWWVDRRGTLPPLPLNGRLSYTIRAVSLASGDMSRWSEAIAVK